MVKVINQNDIKKKDHKEFSLPLVNKFICCFCMPLSSALNLCASLLAGFFLLRIVSTMSTKLVKVSILSYISFILYAIGTVILLLFLYGSIKKNIKYMKPCKYFFIIIPPFNIINMVNKIKRAINEPSGITNELIEIEDPNSPIDTKKLWIMAAAFEIFMEIFFIYFYYAVWSYIYHLEEKDREQAERRKLEENNQTN